MTTILNEAKRLSANATRSPEFGEGWTIPTYPDDNPAGVVMDGEKAVMTAEFTSDNEFITSISEADRDLIRAAPKLADTVAAMTYEYGVEANLIGDRWSQMRIDDHYWRPGVAFVREQVAGLKNQGLNVRMVRRLASTVSEVIE